MRKVIPAARRRDPLVAALAAAGLFCTAVPATAADFVWFGSDGSFEDAANWSPGGVPSAGDGVWIDAGTVTLTGARSIGRLQLLGGRIAASAALDVTGATEWSGGSIGGYGGDVLTRGTLLITGNTNKTLGVSGGSVSGIVNTGKATWSGSGHLDNWSSGRFTNAAGGSFDIRTDADFASGSFVNAGTLTKSVGSSGDATRFSARLDSTGAIDVQQGTLALHGGGNHSGAITVADGAWIEFAGSSSVRESVLQAGSSIVGNVRHVDTFGPTRVQAGARYDTTRTEIAAGGNFAVDADAAARTASLLVAGGRYSGAGHLEVTGATEWSGGSIGGYGGDVLTRGTLQITGNANKTLGVSGGSVSGIVNTGKATWSGSGHLDNWSSGRFTNAAGASFDIRTDADFASGSFVNAGTLTKTVGSAGDATRVSGTLTNTGRIEVGQGTVSVSSAFDNGGVVAVASGTVFEGTNRDFANSGRIEGSGTVRAAAGLDLDNRGVIAPGFGTGLLTLDGDLTTSTGAVLELELAALGDFDRLAVTGDVLLGGTLALVGLGYAPTVGDRFVVMSFDGRLADSTFDALTTAGFGGGVRFDVVYNPHDVTLLVSAVPEPGTWALWLAGLAGVGGVARRRRSGGADR